MSVLRGAPSRIDAGLANGVHMRRSVIHRQASVCGAVPFTTMSMTFPKSLIVLALITISIPPSDAATVSWDASDDTSIHGYRLYRAEGTCAVHGYFFLTNSYGVGTSGLITDPDVGGTYCHFLTAFNSAGESLPSTVVEFLYVIEPPPQCSSKAYCRTLRGKARKQCLACQ